MIIKNKILILSLLSAILFAINFSGGAEGGWFYHMSLYSSFITILIVLLFFVLKMRALHYFIVGFLSIQFIAVIVIIVLLYSEIEARFQPRDIVSIVLLLGLRVAAIYLLATCVVPQSSSTTK
jgi:hypothetical protein